MKRLLIALCAVLLLTSAAEARHRHSHHHHRYYRAHQYQVSWARPYRWCGWFMRKRHGVSDPKFNLARNWAYYGSPARGPAPGVIGVMWHHVFEVVSVVAPGRVLAVSGNDGGAVRTRVRSTRGVIAWRWPGNRSYAMR